MKGEEKQDGEKIQLQESDTEKSQAHRHMTRYVARCHTTQYVEA